MKIFKAVTPSDIENVYPGRFVANFGTHDAIHLDRSLVCNALKANHALKPKATA